MLFTAVAVQRNAACKLCGVAISLDRHGKYYGFISKLPNDIFFHERDNPGLRFSTLYAHDVLYYFKKDKVTYTEKAVNMQPL